MKIFVNKAELLGRCEECGEPTTGSFDSDENRLGGDFEEIFFLVLKCINCYTEYKFQITPEIEVG